MQAWPTILILKVSRRCTAAAPKTRFRTLRLMRARLLRIIFRTCGLAQIFLVTNLSTMREQTLDVTNHQRLAGLGQRVLAGGRLDRDEALFLLQTL